LFDVVIAGTGPVGLFLACERRLAGLAVLVLEQAEDPRLPLKRLPFGMRGLSAPTVEAFHRRGLLNEIAPTPSGVVLRTCGMSLPRRFPSLRLPKAQCRFSG